MICLYRESDHKNKKEKELSWLAGSVASADQIMANLQHFCNNNNNIIILNYYYSAEKLTCKEFGDCRDHTRIKPRKRETTLPHM